MANSVKEKKDTHSVAVTETQKSSPGDRAQAVAVSALERIEQLDLLPVPSIYEVWYRYFQGDPEIVKAIETHQGDLDEEACHAIHKLHLSESARDDAVKKISDQMQAAISELGTMLTSVRSAAGEFGDNIGDFGSKVESASTLEELGTVVTSIVSDTKKMVEKNHDLELQLVNSSRQVTELRLNLDNVQKEALTDSLTGLANRKAFDRSIRDCMMAADETGELFILLMLDIDHFKKFNDTYGHPVGDQVLRLVAKTLTDNVKGRDTAARYGGEEFAIILPETPLFAAMKVAEVLRKSVESKEVINKASQTNLGRITLSIGVAAWDGSESVSGLIERADSALYDATRGGRNCVREAK